MFLKISVYFAFTVFVFCESAFVDTLGKCKINDGNCQRDLFNSVFNKITNGGIPELGFPSLEPLSLEDISVSVLNAINITLLEGYLKGAKDCVVDKFVTDIEDEHAYLELTCKKILVKGKYNLIASSPLIKSAFGGDVIRGNGNGKVKIEKLYLRFDFYFYIERRADGELYIKCKTDKTIYTFDVKGKMTFYADQLYIGDKESSKLVTGMMNDNWRFLVSSFGKPFMDKAMEYVYVHLRRFFDVVPCKHYISDDLSPYARDNE